MNWIAELEKLNACGEALRWCETQESAQSAWLNCERGDWMLWLVGKLAGPPESDSRKALVLTACECARLALPYVRKGETRPLKAIEAAEAYARGDAEVTLQDVRAAYAADDAAYAYAAAYAFAYAAAYATAAAAAAAYAHKSTLKDCADIVRKHYPSAPEGQSVMDLSKISVKQN